MRADDIQYKVSRWLFHDGIPVTKLVIVTNIATFLAMALFQARAVGEYLVFHTSTVLAMPWTIVTYPLLGLCGGVICMLLTVYWLWLAGGSLERSWGSQTYAGFFFGTSALTALGLYIGSILAGTGAGAGGLWLPIAAVTVAWALLNPDQQILFMFFIPLKLKWVALIGVAIVLIEYGSQSLLLGLFALTGCAASYWYVRRGAGLSLGMPQRRESDNAIRVRPSHGRRRTLNPLKWYAQYRERKRLEDLFKRSGMGD